MWVMITGVRHIEDAFNAYEWRANALGLLVEPGQASESSFISPAVAMSITKCIPSVCECVLVTHLIDVREIMHLASVIGVKTIQLPGNVTPEDIVDVKNSLPYIKVIKSLHVVDDYCMDFVERYIDVVDAIELDTIDVATSRIGGTGKTHDWNISRKIVQKYGYKVPIILAGGLNSDNVENAIQTVEPFGVDVSSSVTDSEGFLDEKKLKSFIDNAKHVRCLAH
jgi:phosphoribosylanthranilate isomerase